MHNTNTRPRQNGPCEIPDTLEACEILLEQIVQEAIGLQLSLDQAVERGAMGNPYDRGWFNRAKAKLKHLNHDRTRLLYRCGQMRKEAKAMAQQSLDRTILDVIKESVPAEQFMEFVRQAEARMASTGRPS
ncbi:hypothetical protein [Pseudomonas chlororaphis]|uniref:hypothetical protein n=1 Tax=Pseudomonas chlororaphis TaxID=587753 RepID=UPI002407CC9F|nr:hypothetical protein [Pseudomonas chlororaphis]